MSANDKQVGGSHYKTGGVQHWDIAAKLYGEAHFKCTATKYISRWRAKNGVQDLEKAKHYLEKLIEISPVADLEDRLSASAAGAIGALGLVPVDEQLVLRIFEAYQPIDVMDCIASIDALIAGQAGQNPA